MPTWPRACALDHTHNLSIPRAAHKTTTERSEMACRTCDGRAGAIRPPEHPPTRKTPTPPRRRTRQCRARCSSTPSQTPPASSDPPRQAARRRS
eukprot:6053109-Prymnesium_polylepis.2